MEKQLTFLEQGVFVKISEIELEKLKKQKGFLSRESYPQQYEEIAKQSEVGRFLFLRFIGYDETDLELDELDKCLIEVNITELEEEGKKYIDSLTDGKRRELKAHMVKFLRESYCTGDKEYSMILEFICDFFMVK